MLPAVLRGQEGGQEEAHLSLYTIYRLECSSTGRSYVGASEHIEDRLARHYGHPPPALLRDLTPYEKGKGRSRKQWFLDQVKVHIEATGMWTSREASRQEKHFIQLHPTGYNIIKSGAPGKCKQGYAIMASIRRRK